MKQHVIHLFEAFLSGKLTDEQYLEVASHLDECEHCQLAHDAFFDLDNVGQHQMFSPPIPPPPQLRDSVLSHFSGGRKYAMFTHDVAGMLGLDEAQVTSLFEKLDDLSHWKPGPSKGCHLLPVKSPRDVAFTGFIRLEPGHAFPNHAHHGQEHLFLIAGGYVDSSGAELVSGDHDIHEDGTAHEITAMEWVPCICALVIENGFTFVPSGKA